MFFCRCLLCAGESFCNCEKSVFRTGNGTDKLVRREIPGSRSEVSGGRGLDGALAGLLGLYLESEPIGW